MDHVLIDFTTRTETDGHLVNSLDFFEFDEISEFFEKIQSNITKLIRFR